MPYLRPEDLLRRFSRFTREEVRPAVREDERFVRAQVGSMASTLRFLSGELAGMEEAVDAQHAALADALETAGGRLDDVDGGDAVEDAIAEARESLASPPDDVRDHEAALLSACNRALDAIDGDLDGRAARRVREPLYGFLDTRLDRQLGMLGRDG